VCSIFGDGIYRGLLYICMEFVEGVDLRHLVGRRGGLPPAEAYGTATQIADGLQAIHDIGVVHRDLKTANVMIDLRGVVRLMDFGIAKQWQSESAAGATDTGQLIGTPEYMSPEQIRGEKVDHRSDIYALGIVTFETFTGRVPFRGDTPVATIFKHLQEAVPVATHEGRLVPPELRPVLLKTLAKAPADRYDTAREVAEALRLASSEAGVGATRPSLAGVRPTAPEAAYAATKLEPPPTAPDSGQLATQAQSASPAPTTVVHAIAARPRRVAAVGAIGLALIGGYWASRRSRELFETSPPRPWTTLTLEPQNSPAPSLPASPSPDPLLWRTTVTLPPAGRVYLEDEVEVKPEKIAGSGVFPRGTQLKAGEKVSVVVSFVVTETGDVTNIEIEVPGGAAYDAAMLALSRWKYSPGLKEGVPVKVRLFRKINFRAG
jgi:TonB family protein